MLLVERVSCEEGRLEVEGTLKPGSATQGCFTVGVLCQKLLGIGVDDVQYDFRGYGGVLAERGEGRKWGRGWLACKAERRCLFC